MLGKGLVLVLLALLSGCCCATTDTAKSLSLKLKFTSTICTGTPVQKDVILTAAHCTDKDRPLSFVGDIPVVTVETVTDGKDHVLIRVSGIEFKKWAAFGPSPTQADKLWWVGNPAGLENMYREGYVVRATKEQIYFDAKGFMGDSGAGIFDTQGRLVAVMSGFEYWSDGVSGILFDMSVAFPFAFTEEQWKQMNIHPSKDWLSYHQLH
jgi:hypothetical protein